MDTVIIGDSAARFHDTPPCLKAWTLPPETEQALSANVPALAATANAYGSACILRRHLFGALKGLDLPIDLAAPRHAPAPMALIRWHESRYPYEARDLIQIDDGLFVTTPERTALDLASRRKLVLLLKLLFSWAGIYALCPSNQRIAQSLDTMLLLGLIHKDLPRRIFAYRDLDGTPLFWGPAMRSTWEPCFDIGGSLTDLWKRPPLLTPASLAAMLDEAPGARPGVTRLSRAAQLVIPGAASPAETLFALLAHLPRKLGGEGLQVPHLNRRIRLAPAAARALGHPICVGDVTWEDASGRLLPVCAEVDGKSFHGYEAVDPHADARVRDDSARVNALKASGFEVVSVTYSQMASLSRWEIAMGGISSALGLEWRGQTPAFLRQRGRLRDELFGRGGCKVVGG